MTASDMNPPSASAHRWPFRGFGTRHVLVAIGFSILVTTHSALSVTTFGQPLQPGAVLTDALMMFGIGIAAVATAVAVDSLLGEGWSQALKLAIAVGLATIVGVALCELMIYGVIEPAGLPLGDFDAKNFASPLHRIAFRGAGAASWSLLLIAVYAMLEANRRATERLHALRVAAVAAERALLEEGLRGVQERLDPEWLCSSLLEVDEAYGRDLAAGEQKLDALILRLRAATQRG